jgi:hypothetical protein
MKKRHRIQFPKRDTEQFDQDEIFFYLIESAGKKKIDFMIMMLSIANQICMSNYFMRD